jgi:hypothetical protein
MSKEEKPVEKPAEVQTPKMEIIMPPQSISIKNSMPKDGVVPEIISKIKNGGASKKDG